VSWPIARPVASSWENRIPRGYQPNDRNLPLSMYAKWSSQ
jgi:hypothetical protein